MWPSKLFSWLSGSSSKISNVTDMGYSHDPVTIGGVLILAMLTVTVVSLGYKLYLSYRDDLNVHVSADATGPSVTTSTNVSGSPSWPEDFLLGLWLVTGASVLNMLLFNIFR